jgi:hypothetical protein
MEASVVKILSSEEVAVVAPAVEGKDSAMVALCKLEVKDLISP